MSLAKGGAQPALLTQHFIPCPQELSTPSRPTTSFGFAPRLTRPIFLCQSELKFLSQLFGENPLAKNQNRMGELLPSRFASRSLHGRPSADTRHAEDRRVCTRQSCRSCYRPSAERFSVDRMSRSNRYQTPHLLLGSPKRTLAHSIAAFGHQQHRPAASAVTNSLRQALVP